MAKEKTMTPQEAIEILSSESYIGNSKLDDAIEYAIKVLSALKKADMTREERKNVLHCLKTINDEEICEECNLYGTTGTDHCQYDCVKLAIEYLSEPTNTLVKIRLEIEEERLATGHTKEYWDGINKALAIIDKYGKVE